MKIEVFTLAWNEPVSIRRFCEVYQKFADRVVVYDYGSTDHTMDVVREFGGVEARASYRGMDARETGLLVKDFTSFKRNVWRESAADWVVVVDPDEWLYHPNMREYLAGCLHHLALRARGYNVIGSSDLAVLDGLAKWYAVFNKFYNKPCVFQPNSALRDEKEYMLLPGGHTWVPMASSRRFVEICHNSELLLLHARWLGPQAAIAERTRSIVANRSEKEHPSRSKYDKGYPKTLAAAVKAIKGLRAQSVSLSLVIQVHEQLHASSGSKIAEVVKLLTRLSVKVPGTRHSKWNRKSVQKTFGIPDSWPWQHLRTRQRPRARRRPRARQRSRTQQGSRAQQRLRARQRLRKRLR